jgi:two-component system CitB family sensor kinase
LLGHDVRVRRAFPLSVQLLAMQVAIVLATLVSAGFLATHVQTEQIRSTYAGRVLTIARSLAALPAVKDAYQSDDPSATLQPLAEQVRASAGAEFVVFTDAHGIRYSHPDPAEIGHRVSTDPSIALEGGEFVGTETGTLGRSLRAKVPVRRSDGEVVGVVSVGVLESRLSADEAHVVPRLVAWLTAAALVGLLGAVLVTRLVRRRIYGLEPEEIVELLQAREAMLHGVREGVVAVDSRGRVVLVNDEAIRLLDLPGDVTGRSAEDVLANDLLPLTTAGEDVADKLVLAGERLLVVNSTTARVGDRDVGRIMTLRDRTELFDALRALDGQRDITDALRAQAHEFSNNLHVVSGLIDLGRPDEAVDFIERVGGGSGTTYGASLREVEDPAVAAVLVTKTATARERGVAFLLDPESEVADGVGDDVVTIIGNLVDNAVEATGPGGSVAVFVRGTPQGGVEIRVRDDGPGVPADLRDRIFDTGVTTKAPTADHHGRGIGLALVARIVRRRGGSIELTDADGGGSQFTVALPPQPTAVGSARDRTAAP